MFELGQLVLIELQSFAQFVPIVMPSLSGGSVRGRDWNYGFAGSYARSMRSPVPFLPLIAITALLERAIGYLRIRRSASETRMIFPYWKRENSGTSLSLVCMSRFATAQLRSNSQELEMRLLRPICPLRL